MRGTTPREYSPGESGHTLHATRTPVCGDRYGVAVLRPGEKRREEISDDGERVLPTRHPKVRLTESMRLEDSERFLSTVAMARPEEHGRKAELVEWLHALDRVRAEQEQQPTTRD